MAPIIYEILRKLVVTRVLTKSSIDGAVAIATAVAIDCGVGVDVTTLQPGSTEANVATIALALLGVYRVFKKGKTL